MSPNPNSNTSIICDLSGTLFTDSLNPNPPVVAVVKSMQAQGYGIIFITGLRQKHRAAVEARLDDLGLKPGFDANVVLFMRGDSDTRSPLTYKEELLQNFIWPSHILLALDDTPSILRMYAKHGIATMQVRART